MATIGIGPKSMAFLRQKAEALQKSTPAKPRRRLSKADTLKLVHELDIHQVELELQNEELTQAFSAAQDAIALYDLAPAGFFTLSKEREIINLNLCGSQMLGKERSRLINSSLGFFISNDTKPAYNLFLDKVFTGKPKESCEVKLLTNSNMPMFVHLTGMVTKNGEQCLITMVDITERKRSEDILQNAQRLDSLGVLAGGIAHDFNNLLGGIFGFIDLANHETKDPQVTSYLSKALESIDRSRGLTRQLLTFAKGGAPVRKTGHIAPIIQDTVQFALSGSSIACRFEIPEDLWSCNIDVNQINQVINNLIINAQQAMPNGGTIVARAENVILQEKEHVTLAKGNYVKISITDFGIGIPEEILPRIFDPFFTTKSMGQGLGLSICYSIVNRHGGYIDVESEPGKGSTFHVFLPASTESVSVKAIARKHTPANAANVIKHKGGRIIVMDDEEIMRDVIKEMLELLGYAVECTKDGREAMDLFISEKKSGGSFVALIFDLTVAGGMGGKTAIEELRQLDGKIPVFVSSAYSDDPVMRNPSDYGFTASISKPFWVFDLAEMLEKFIKSNA